MTSIVSMYDFINNIKNEKSNNICVIICADNTSYIMNNIRPTIYKNNSRLRTQLVGKYKRYFNKHTDEIDKIICDCKNINENMCIYIITSNPSKYMHILNRYKNMDIRIIKKLDFANIDINKAIHVIDTTYNYKNDLIKLISNANINLIEIF